MTGGRFLSPRFKDGNNNQKSTSRIKKTFILEELMSSNYNQKRQNSKTGALVPENRTLGIISYAEIKCLNLRVG
jgi:hypothetical protein